MTNEKIKSIERNPHGEPLGWGATPMIGSRVSEQQREVRGTLHAYCTDTSELGFEVAPSITTYVSNVFFGRVAAREAENYNHYATRLVQDTDHLDQETLEIIDRAERGKASPAELLYIRELLGIASVELGCVTHPYGKRIELLDEMRIVVAEAIEIFDGRSATAEIFEVRQHDGLLHNKDRVTNAVLMTRKRDIGVLPDGTVIRERSSFIVVLDELAKIDVRLASEIRKISIEDKKWAEKVMKAGVLYAIVPALLRNNNFAAAIPLSTTVYAFNDETHDAIRKRDAEERTKQKNAFDQNYPLLAKLMNRQPLTQDDLS